MLADAPHLVQVLVHADPKELEGIEVEPGCNRAVVSCCVVEFGECCGDFGL